MLRNWRKVPSNVSIAIDRRHDNAAEFISGDLYHISRTDGQNPRQGGAVGEFAAQGRFDSKDRVSFCLGIDIVKNWHPIPN